MAEAKKKLDTGLTTPEPKAEKMDRVDMLCEAISKLNEAVVTLGGAINDIDKKLDDHKNLFATMAKAGRM